MHVVIFEGSQWRQFAPLTLSRPSFQLNCGLGSLLQKQIRATHPKRLTLWVRPELESYCRQFILPYLPCPAAVNVPLDDETALLLNGRTVHMSRFDYDNTPCVVVDDSPSGPLVRQAITRDAGLAPSDLFNRTDRWMKLVDLPHSMPQSRLPEYIWDLISWNEETIVSEFIAEHEPSQPRPAGSYHMVEDDGVWLGPGVTLGPGCVLDASKGPVILAAQSSVGANAVLLGPCYVGPHSQISPLSVIRTGVSIGPMCKIGGEVSNSIIMGYTNKPHDGFLGDSYIGEWCNLGAGTTTSNLKNTYSPVSMSLGDGIINTGRRFLGSLIGDHSKLAIGTRLMGGTYIGYSAMVAVSHFVPKFVRSFSFLTDSGNAPYQIDKAAAVMKEVFNRRQRAWTLADDEMNRYALETAKSIEMAGGQL